MKNVIPAATTSTVAATSENEAIRITGLRSLILDLLFSSPVISAKEWATAVERTSNCVDAATLAKWYRNSVVEIANREEGAPTGAPVIYATSEQKQEITRLLNHHNITRRHKTRVLLTINRLLTSEARSEIARLTAYLADPFGGGVAVNAFGELVWGYPLTA